MSPASSMSAAPVQPSRGGGGRWLFAVFAAGAVTFALFALMQLLVAVDVITIEEPAEGPPIQIRIDVPDIDPRPDREPPTLEAVDPPPPAPRIDASTDTPSQAPTASPSPPPVDVEAATGTVEVALPPPPLDIRVPPAYPRREQMRGVEGRCTVRYDILASGATANIQVLACDSAGFADATVEAVERWRHAARRGGAPNEVMVRGHTTTLDFTLER
ncbi:MAG: TonB family protein [Oceanicaulis sp.]